jgi:signal transduction histidine kinase
MDDNGRLVYYVITERDITDERNIYLELRKHNAEISKTNEAINRYEDQLGYLLEQSEMFIWHFDPNAEVIHFTVNPHEKGYSETFEEFFAGVPEKERMQSMGNLRDLVRQRQPFNLIHHYNYTPMERGPVWYAISGIPTFNERGQLIEYFGVARNITDLMEAQQKLKEETARAEDSGRMKAAFLANMTHEIRTPLNAIVGFSDLLQMVDNPEERKEFIRIIRNNCDMLLRLINDILEASNMGQALAIEPVKCDFAQVFDDICQTLEQRVTEAGIPFIKDNPYPTFPVTIDKGRIQQVLTNFTTNAVKYTKTGHIKVGYREQEGGIYLYCEDTGAGIPKEKQDAVFERFVKLNDFVQGTGLGLSICKAIAERCNGEIGVTSEGEGQGSTFWLWIPKDMPCL